MAKKIAENIWEIPKEGKMHVPGKIFASDVLMESIQRDGKTIQQVKNVAQLKGIIGESIAMSDAHQGYGFPIGGVAAFDLKEGIISPGGVGYDINCLTGDSRILTELGISLPLEKFDTFSSEIEVNNGDMKLKKALFHYQLQTLNETTKKKENKPILFFMSKDSQEVYEVELSSGIKIKSTSDHPFLTKDGMKQLSCLTTGDAVAVHFFEGVACNEVISREKGILAKILGYMFGDGCFYTTKGKSYAAAYGTIGDLETMKKDLASIGVNSSIYSRKRDHKIKTRYGEATFNSTNHELHIHSKEFCELLEESGIPIGNKTRQAVRVPLWIKNGNLAVKRLFLAGFFGAEMSSPTTLSKTCFQCPTVNQNKITSLKQNCRDFLIDIATMLEEFGIKNWTISEMDDFHNKYGENTSRLRLMIKGEKDMLTLWRNIGFEYNVRRQNLANIASFYILLKMKEHEKRISNAQKIKGYKKKGLTIGEVKRLLEHSANERFIERHYYEDAGQRISLDFIGFDDFRAKNLEELQNFGTIFDTIVKITLLDGTHKVYDFTVQDNHNFIANNFVVSNCGVRLLATSLQKEEFMKQRAQVLDAIGKQIPTGTGKGSAFSVSDKELDTVLEKGVNWAVEHRYATRDDLLKIEDNGCIEGSDARMVSEKAKARGRGQLGSLGSGNHFLEIQVVEQIFDAEKAKHLGLQKGQIVVMIHSGSRGLGHQVASDYIMKMEKEYGSKDLPDRELICAPIESKLGKEYRAAMAAAANFAFVNRQLMAHQVRKTLESIFQKIRVETVYDIAHNIAKFEEHVVDGKKMIVCVHRKGATRSFGPGRKEIPAAYRKIGCPIFIPGSMGTYSFVLVGTKRAEELSFGSTAHGAGRVLSRSYAIKNITPEQVQQELKAHDVSIKAGSKKGMVEEAPKAYKDVNEVVRVSHELGIGLMVARLKPLAVVKG